MDVSAIMTRSPWLGVEWELQVGVFLVLSLAVQLRKSSNVDEWIPKVFLWCKVAIIILTWSCSRVIMSWYVFAFCVAALLLHQPEYSGRSNVRALTGSEFVNEIEVAPRKGITYVVEFYTTWAYHCKQFAPVFAKLSLRYGGDKDKLRFVKVNVGRLPDVAKRYNVSVEAFKNKELPTIMLFKDGKPIPDNRLPPKNPDGSIHEVVLSEANVTKYFDLRRRAIGDTVDKDSGKSKKGKKGKKRR